MDMRKILEKKQKRAQLVEQARGLLDRAEGEKRNLTAEERQQYDEIMDKANDLTATIQRMEQQRSLEDDLEGSSNDSTPPPAPGDNDQSEERSSRIATEEYRNNFRMHLRTGRNAHNLLVTGESEERGMQADNQPEGGFVVAPQQFAQQLLQELDDMVFIRQLATVETLQRAESLGVPTLDEDLDDAEWTAELTPPKEDDGLKFGKREWRPHPLTKEVKVSRKLVRVSVFDIEKLVRQRLNAKFARTTEKSYLFGDGQGKPLGMFVASKDGISTNRDISQGNYASRPTFDGLTAAKYSLKGQFWKNARWMFHRDVLKEIALLKDNNGQYLWRQSVRVGEPDTILGFGLMMSEYAPNTLEANAYAGILGDFGYYWIADSLELEIQVLLELYARTNEIGYIGRLESDGMPVSENAFARVKLGESDPV